MAGIKHIQKDPNCGSYPYIAEPLGWHQKGIMGEIIFAFRAGMINTGIMLIYYLPAIIILALLFYLLT